MPDNWNGKQGWKKWDALSKRLLNFLKCAGVLYSQGFDVAWSYSWPRGREWSWLETKIVVIENNILWLHCLQVMQIQKAQGSFLFMLDASHVTLPGGGKGAACIRVLVSLKGHSFTQICLWANGCGTCQVYAEFRITRSVVDSRDMPFLNLT